jgi:hypothetical protein
METQLSDNSIWSLCKQDKFYPILILHSTPLERIYNQLQLMVPAEDNICPLKLRVKLHPTPVQSM